MTALLVRKLMPQDRQAWEVLWRGYQAFYGIDVSRETTEETWRRFSEPAEPVTGYAAFADEVLVGIAHTIAHRSTWSERDQCYLHDLFTDEAYRGRGVARALIERIREDARADGCARVHWLTHETNARAKLLYDHLARRTGFVDYSLPL